MWPGALLLLLRQRQWPLVEQPRLERQLLVFDVEQRAQRPQSELQLGRSEPAEQQQSVQRVRGASGSAYNSDVHPFSLIIHL